MIEAIGDIAIRNNVIPKWQIMIIHWLVPLSAPKKREMDARLISNSLFVIVIFFEKILQLSSLIDNCK